MGWLGLQNPDSPGMKMIVLKVTCILENFILESKVTVF